MKESKYIPIILKELDKKPVSIGTLKQKCGQGHKITNIRKALYQLLKNNIIEINGYNNECKTFNYDSIMLKKVDTSLTNPIYVKGLLDNPLKDNNYMKIRELYRKRIEEINKIYYNEIEELNNITGKMPLKIALKKGYLKESDTFKILNVPDSIKMTFSEILNIDPNASVWYFKKRFSSELALMWENYNVTYPYFGKRARVEYQGHEQGDLSFVSSYISFLDDLPINRYAEEFFFRVEVIGALSAKEEDKEKFLWETAINLTTKDLIDYVNTLRRISLTNEADPYAPSLDW